MDVINCPSNAAGCASTARTEIAGYGSARTHAQLLSPDRVAALLEKTLGEEKDSDAKN
jgi:ferritin-like metal-binding protein YciE